MPRFISIIMIALVALTASCRPKNSGADTKTKPGVQDAFDGGFSLLERVQKEKICAANILVVFVGNAEPLGIPKYSAELQRTGMAAKLQTIGANQEAAYAEVVKKAQKQLQESLRISACPGDVSQSGRISLLSIYDGPVGFDSSISLSSYGWENRVWTQIGVNQDFSFNLAAGLLEGAKRFELNLPASVSKIVETVAKKYVRPQQIIYIFKSHGAKVATSMTAVPKLSESFAISDQRPDIRHAFLVDVHGESGEPLTSGLVSALWSKDAACKMLRGEALRKAECGAAGVDALLDAARQQAELAQGNGSGSPTQDNGSGSPTQGNGSGSPTQGNGSGSPTQGNGSGSPTQGNGSGSPTQGNGSGSPTQGNGSGSPTQGNGSGSPTQGNGSGSPTQGNGSGSPTQGNGSGSPTQGNGSGSPTQDNYFNQGTQGAGKGLLLIRAKLAPIALDQSASDSNPEIMIEHGAFASYEEDLQVPGVNRLVLSAGTDTVNYPTGIFVDSCYGSDVIAKNASFRDNILPSEDSKTMSSVVVIYSEVPTYFYTIDYRYLPAHILVGLPMVKYWSSPVANEALGPNITSFMNEQAGQLDILATNELSQVTPQYLETVRKEYQIDKPEADYLRLKTAVVKVSP